MFAPTYQATYDEILYEPSKESFINPNLYFFNLNF